MLTLAAHFQYAQIDGVYQEHWLLLYTSLKTYNLLHKLYSRDPQPAIVGA